jgi:pilus assembly protein Flp/PilA
MTKLIARFAKDESGVTAIEYGLIAALIGLAVLTGAEIVGTQLDRIFTDVGTSLTGKQVNTGS